MNINEVISGALYTKLHGVSSIATLVTDRIWYGAAIPGVETAYPYILMSYASGGMLNDAPYEAADVTFMVTGLDKTKPGAKAIATRIDTTLRRQTIIYPDGWYSWARVRQLDEYSRVFNVNNAQYHQEGAYYRFRLSKGL